MQDAEFFMAELATRKYQFHAFGMTEADALAALRAGIVRHKGADSSDVSELMQDANAYPCQIGAAYRDGRLIK